MSNVSNLGENLLKSVDNFHFFFKRAVVLSLSDFHSVFDDI